MITLILILLVIVLSTGVAVSAARLIGRKSDPAITSDYRENYLAFDLEQDDIFLPQESGHDLVFKGMLLAESHWKQRGYVEEWLQLYKAGNDKWIVIFRSKTKSGWKCWTGHPSVKTLSELETFLYSSKVGDMQERVKSLIRDATQYDPALKNILYKRIGEKTLGDTGRSKLTG